MAIGAFGFIGVIYAALTGPVGLGGTPLGVWIGAGVWAVLCLGLAWYVDPAVRQRRYLRKYPWVEFPDAAVERTAYTKVGRVKVVFTDASGKQYRYQMAPNDDDFAEGERAIWFAGQPGHNGAVISLRDGACTGMAYISWVGSRYSSSPMRRA
ncbi:MAG: hypothetical protein ACRDPH_11590 [Marmoricola sp.]